LLRSHKVYYLYYNDFIGTIEEKNTYWLRGMGAVKSASPIRANIRPSSRQSPEKVEMPPMINIF
jgi:hypothetical protein